MSHRVSVQTGQHDEAPQQVGHHVAQILTLSRGVQKNEKTVSHCWKLRADSPPPPKLSRLAGGNAHLGGEAVRAGEDGRQVVREKAYVIIA